MWLRLVSAIGWNFCEIQICDLKEEKKKIIFLIYHKLYIAVHISLFGGGRVSENCNHENLYVFVYVVVIQDYIDLW